MKLNHFIKEATAPMAAPTSYPPVTEEDVMNMCDCTGNITIDNNVVNVGGDVTLKANKVKMLKELPFKFGEVSRFDAQDATKLTSLVNFPNRATTIDISYNLGLRSFEGGDNIECTTFSAEGTSVTSFNGCPLAEVYDFNGCAAVTSAAGVRTDILKTINLIKCNSLTDIRNLVSLVGGKDAKGKIAYNPNLPLIALILNSGQPNRIAFDLNAVTDSKLIAIYREYKGKGLGFAIELADELRNKGFEGNCSF